MSWVVPVVGVLLTLVLGAAGCATSEEERCTRSGGVWQETFCERPAR